jgi:Phage major capsid protein E
MPNGNGEPTLQAGPVVTNVDYGLFNTVTIIESYKIRYPVPALVRDTFFQTREFSDAEIVRIDSKLGGRGLAPFILPLENQVVGRRRPFKETYIPAPIIAPARVITPRELRGPQMGESIYNYKTPEERFAEIVIEDGEDMDDEIARTEEWMCCQCMFSGKIPINYRNKTNVVIDYGFTNTTVLAKKWSDPTSYPLSDLAAAQGLLNANGYSGNVAIYSPDAWNALWANPNVQNAMKNVYPPFIPYSGLPGSTQISPAGVQRGPSFTAPVMENWIYYGTFTKGDPANPGQSLATQYVPKGCVLIGSSDVKNRIVYGVVIQIEQEDGQFHYYSSDRVPKVECNVNKNFYMQTVTSRPVPVPVDLLSWAVVSNCI